MGCWVYGIELSKAQKDGEGRGGTSKARKEIQDPTK
jgi:hypothetical protein